MLAIRLPEEIEARLDKLAKRTGRTKTFYARQAILEHLDDLEDIYLAERRLANLRAGRTRSVKLNQVLKAHELGERGCPLSPTSTVSCMNAVANSSSA
jgi:RHH-type rel operon transcriptional repressor/antitoxin RelB